MELFVRSAFMRVSFETESRVSSVMIFLLMKVQYLTASSEIEPQNGRRRAQQKRRRDGGDEGMKTDSFFRPTVKRAMRKRMRMKRTKRTKRIKRMKGKI